MRREKSVRRGNLAQDFKRLVGFFRVFGGVLSEKILPFDDNKKPIRNPRRLLVRKKFRRVCSNPDDRNLDSSRKELSSDPFQPDGVAQTFRKSALIAAVRIHLEDHCANLLLFHRRRYNSSRPKYKVCRSAQKRSCASNASRRIYNSNRNREKSRTSAVLCRSVSFRLS